MSIDLTIDGAVATIVINRPERMNAMDAEHYRDLSRAWTEVRDDAAIRVAIVTGAGERAFTAGADLKSHAGRRDGWAELWLTQKDPLLNRGLEVWKPVVAAVNGVCLAGGMTLLFATDLRVASETATFGVSEVKRGLLPGNGGTQRIAAQFPHAIAMEMLLLGDTMTAVDALRWGLVNKVVPPGPAVLEAARDYAERLAANAPLAVQATKELAIRSRDLPLADGLRMEVLMQRILRETEDLREGTRAFAEKRVPAFKGR